MKRKRKLKKKFVIFLYSYALLLVSYFTLTTLARYTTSLNKDGNIPVAKWDVSIIGEDNKELQTMYIGDSSTYQSYNLSVTSKSEIAINYSAIIKNVPTGVRVQVDNGNIYEESKGTITIQDFGSFNANDINNTHNHILTIQVPSESVTEQFTKQMLEIDVIFTQINL